MSARLTLATARRVLTQLRHDPRTILLLLIVPTVLLVLLAWIFDGTTTFQRIGPALLGVFPFVVMFLVSSVTTLRERTGGTLERLLSMPIAKMDVLVGYALAFGAVALVQAFLASAVARFLLGLHVRGPWWLLVLAALASAWLGTALGLLLSAFAATEFQAVQFLPAAILPQFLLCGLLVARSGLPDVLSTVSDALPLSYAVDAMARVAQDAQPYGDVARDLAVVLAFTGLALAGGAATLRRRRA